MRGEDFLHVKIWLFFSALGMFPCQLLAAPNFEADIRPYLQAHCVGCHGPDKQESEFRVDQLSSKVGLENTPQWAEVIERINSGEMPPKELKKQPAASESAAIVEWLAARIKEGQSARLAK